MKTEWILLANAAIARLFRRDPPADALIPLETLEHPQSRLKGSQLSGERPGHEATDHSSGGNRYEPREDVRRKEHRHFAKEVAERLNAGLLKNEYGALRIFASDPFLGELKAQLSPAVTKQVRAAVDLDMTSLGLAEIEDRLRQLHPERSGL